MLQCSDLDVSVAIIELIRGLRVSRCTRLLSMVAAISTIVPCVTDVVEKPSLRPCATSQTQEKICFPFLATQRDAQRIEIPRSMVPTSALAKRDNIVAQCVRVCVVARGMVDSLTQMHSSGRCALEVTSSSHIAWLKSSESSSVASRRFGCGVESVLS